VHLHILYQVNSSGTSAVAGPLNLTGLTAGEYTVTARLVNPPFCTVSTIFSINQPAEALAIAETHTVLVLRVITMDQYQLRQRVDGLESTNMR
jgi:hypothetical protein